MAKSEHSSERVEIPVEGETLVGTLHVPEGPGPFAALVFLGPLTSVKEQVVGHYARAMARRGFATLAFDNRHFGESSGAPRQYEDPERKIADVRAAIGWLSANARVDATKIGAVGVCAGGGYMAGAVATDDRVRAFAAVAGFFHDAEKQRQWMGDKFDVALERAKAARAAFESNGTAETIPAVGKGDVAMPLDEAFEYYGTPRGAHPNYKNEFAVMSREKTLVYDAQHFADAISVPTLMIHSEKALAPALARAFFERLKGDKRDLWMSSKGQIDFYDDPEKIEPAADELARHFSAQLGA